MKKCQFCGQEIEDDAKQCPKCRRILENPYAQTPSLTVPTQIKIETTDQSQAATIKYAGFWIRFAASFIDGIIVSLISCMPIFLIGIFLGLAGLGDGAKIITQIISYFISFGYFILLTYKKEATWGKMALGLKVIPSDKEKLSLGQVIMREVVGKFISGLTLGIGYLMVAFTEKKEALHDKIAKTNVIYADPNKKSKTWIIVLVLVFFFVVVVGGILASIVLVSLNSAREKVLEKANEARSKADSTIVIPKQ
jgi:uncharacterized RDD family membrane protein YckC